MKKSKKEMEDKIKQLEEKLSGLKKQLEPKNHSPPKPAWMKEDIDRVKFDHEFDTIKEIGIAKKQVIARAGTVKTTEDGSVDPQDKVETVKIPSKSIHEFTNKDVCECECHDNGKMDCQHCYDHMEHLENKKINRDKSLDGYDEEKIMELIEADKVKKDKKPSWIRKLLQK